MRRILRRREVIEDDWRYWGEEAAAGAAAAQGNDRIALVLPLAEFRTNIARWRAYAGPLGVRLSPADAVEILAEDIHRLSLVAAEFPGPGDGYAHAFDDARDEFTRN